MPLTLGYQQGSWTPVLTSNTGTITAYTATGVYTRIGNVVHFEIDLLLTTPGTAGGYLAATLPFTSTATSCAIAGRETAQTGFALSCSIPASSASVNFVKYDNTFLGSAFGRFILTGFYFV